MPLTVGMLARRCGITVRALHYYDQTGLLKPVGRSTSGYRLYDEASVSTIRTIQALRGLGLTLI
ncbi:MerR family transcriptional regulator [Burkholderia ubonensis]|uniref:MerR family transcriptional regulator n=1 Tax=Burkholderia ubonensis TaxID=101571 RepID=UPI0009B36AD4|nr:MerR family transcriptional regulator [Burkholderia ubonensis]